MWRSQYQMEGEGVVFSCCYMGCEMITILKGQFVGKSSEMHVILPVFVCTRTSTVQCQGVCAKSGDSPWLHHFCSSNGLPLRRYYSRRVRVLMHLSTLRYSHQSVYMICQKQTSRTVWYTRKDACRAQCLLIYSSTFSKQKNSRVNVYLCYEIR